MNDLKIISSIKNCGRGIIVHYDSFESIYVHLIANKMENLELLDYVEKSDKGKKIILEAVKVKHIIGRLLI